MPLAAITIEQLYAVVQDQQKQLATLEAENKALREELEEWRQGVRVRAKKRRGRKDGANSKLKTIGSGNPR